MTSGVGLTPGEPVRRHATVVVASTRAAGGLYPDRTGPVIAEWLHARGFAVTGPIVVVDGEAVGEALRMAVDGGAHLVLTTGGTGPAPRDVTPEATLAVAHKEMPGFGEQMRQISLRFVPTAILSRQVAVVRDQSLIINLPGQPKAIAETLEGLKDAEGRQIVPGIFAAVPYCIDLIGGPYLETREDVCKAFRPKNAQRPAAS